MTKVETEWLLQVRDLLYRLACNPGSLGEKAECLGSHIPGFLKPPIVEPITESIAKAP